MSDQLPSHARIVIVGGGVIGLSVAYHLAKRGERDVLLLERRELTCGTTWHAAGLVTQLRATENMSRLAAYTATLFRDLAGETGQETGFRQCGSVTVATTPERLQELKRGASMGRNFGLQVEMIAPSEVRRFIPHINLEGVLGAAWIESDGKTNPVDTARAFAAGARSRGVRIVENTEVVGLRQRGNRVVAVETPEGEIQCDVAVLCCGMWTRDLAVSMGVTVPLQAAEHFYAVTEAITDLPSAMPTLRDMDGRIYVKEDAGKLLIGCFEAEGKPWATNGIPKDFCFDELPDDIEHFAPYLQHAIHRLPVLEHTGIQIFFNGPESFTPDNRFIIGESPEIDALFIAAGFNSCGIESSGGAGKVLADWILNGVPGADFWDVDVRRVMPFQRNRHYLTHRTREIMGTLYGIHWPQHELVSARGVRRSPIHEQLSAAGACFGQAAGFERPLWFGEPGASNQPAYSFERPNWFDAVAGECAAAREAAVLFDQSSFQHILVEGRDALALLQWLSAADIDVPIGRVVYTPWLNDAGGFESDLTITRTGEQVFLVVTTAAQKIRDLAWLRRQRSAFGHVSIIDVAAGYATLSIMGPRSRRLLEAVSPADFSETGFAFGSARIIEIGDGLAMAQRITFVGELGWELHIESDLCASIFESLLAAGKSHQLRLAGYHALDSLRSECGFRDWGLEISDEDNPLAAGLGFAMAWSKPMDFLGKKALLTLRDQPLRKRLCQVKLEKEAPPVFGTEPLWRDGVRVGYLKSGAFGHSLRRPIGMGYVNRDTHITPQWLSEGRWEVEVGGIRYIANVQLKPWLSNVAKGPVRELHLLDSGATI